MALALNFIEFSAQNMEQHYTPYTDLLELFQIFIKDLCC